MKLRWWLSALLAASLLMIFAGHAHGQWTWLYPKPQSHNLQDAVFLDATTVVAVGEAGTILVSHDTGDSWSVRTFVDGVAGQLRRVDRVDATTVVAVGQGGVILRSTDTGATWSLVPSGTTTDLIDVGFADDQHGLAISATKALRTGDGGTTWQVATLPVAVTSMDIVTATYAVAVGDYGLLLRSGDGGATWFVLSQPVFWQSAEVEFRDALRGVVGGAYASFMTTDGGTTWTNTFVWPELQWEPHWSIQPREFVYVSADQVFGAISATYTGPEASPLETPTGALDCTLNNGASWTHDAWSIRSMNGLARNDNGVVMMVGDEGQIYRRSAGGVVTQIAGSPVDYQLGGSGLSFRDASNGVVMSSDDAYFRSGCSEVARTSDGGATWYLARVTNTELNAITHASDHELYAAGQYIDGAGSILRSQDDGATWSSVYLGSTAQRLDGIAFASLTHGVAVGTNGQAIVIDNGTPMVVSTGATAELVDVGFPSPLIAVAVGQNGTIVRSIDAGQSWTTASSGVTNYLVAVDFASSTIGYAVGTNIVLRTDNAGTTWSPVAAPSAQYTDVDFIDALHGAIAGYQDYYSGVFLVTDNGGLSWTPQTPPVHRALTHVSMFASDHAFAGGVELLLLEFGHATPTAVPVPTPNAQLRIVANVPNPFNPVTTIRFVVPEKMHVTLSVHDVAGRVVATLLDDVRDPGQHAITWDAQGVASGVYFARLRAGKAEVSRKMVLLK